MKTQQKPFFFYWLPVVALCLALFVQSGFPSPNIGPDFPFKDKVLHMAAYGLLAVLFYRACRAARPGRWSPLRLLVIGVCFATLYGASDELHQVLVVSRQADAYDFLADFAGSVLGVMGYMAVTAKRGIAGRAKMKP